MRKRILFVDNNASFLNTRSEWLIRAGFEVIKATSLEAAQAILQNQWIHLIITDLRLRNDDDERDISGLILAKDPVYRAIPKIILTGFPEIEYIREAMGRDVDGQAAAVDFLIKKEDYSKMLERVNKAFQQHVGLNWDLDFYWQFPLRFENLIDGIEPVLKESKRSEKAAELEDLLRSLFPHSRQLTLERLLFYQPGWIGLAGCVFSKEGVEQPIIINCGHKATARKEYDNRQKIPGLPPSHRVETVNFGAVSYSLGELEKLVPLVQFYREQPVNAFCAALHHLFETSLEPLHNRGIHLDQPGSTFFYTWLGLAVWPPEKLNQHLTILCERALANEAIPRLEYSPHELIFHRPQHPPTVFPNPMLYLFQAGELTILPPYGLTYGQTHGILANLQAQTWLVDFSQMEPGPLVRDFVALETVLKFEGLPHLDITARYDLEQRLLANSSLTDPIDPGGLDLELHPVVAALTIIRQRAANTGIDLTSYLNGLFLYAIGHLTHYPTHRLTGRSELISYLHALLSAAMLGQKLNPLPSQAFYSLWIDKIKTEVWVEGEKVDLAPTEYALLELLYSHANEICTREEISRVLFNSSYNAINEDALNTTMTRLRGKIETEERRGKYIETFRGRGYQLNIKK